MVTESDIIQIVLTKKEVQECIKKAIDVKFLDNLRNRDPRVNFDCKLRGYVGELAMSKWLASHGVSIQGTNMRSVEDSIDIDFLVAGKNLELKTSLIPDIDQTIRNTVNKRDIKLIRRGAQNIEQLKGDVHLQIYFVQRRKKKDDWLKKQNIDLNNEDPDYLYRAFRGDAYLNRTFFVAWIDKATLVKNINSMPERDRCWSFKNSLRQFWRCPIKDSRPPRDLIDYLKTNTL